MFTGFGTCLFRFLLLPNCQHVFLQLEQTGTVRVSDGVYLKSLRIRKLSLISHDEDYRLLIESYFHDQSLTLKNRNRVETSDFAFLEDSQIE